MLTHDTLYDIVYDEVIHILTLLVYSAICSCLDLDNSFILPFGMVQWYIVWYSDTHSYPLFSRLFLLDLDNSVILPFCMI